MVGERGKRVPWVPVPALWHGQEQNLWKLHIVCHMELICRNWVMFHGSGLSGSIPPWRALRLRRVNRCRGSNYQTTWFGQRQSNQRLVKWYVWDCLHLLVRCSKGSNSVSIEPFFTCTSNFFVRGSIKMSKCLKMVTVGDTIEHYQRDASLFSQFKWRNHFKTAPKQAVDKPIWSLYRNVDKHCVIYVQGTQHCTASVYTTASERKRQQVNTEI